MKKMIYNILSDSHRKKAIKKLKKLESQLLSQSARFAIPFVFRGNGHFKSIACMQNPNEIERLFNLICKIKPKSLVEIGTAKGGALYLWCQAADPHAKVVSIDLPDGEFGGGYLECKIPFYESFKQEHQTIHLLRADSHNPQTVAATSNIFDGEKIDLLIIDGDHTYKGVKEDFENYKHLVKSGGMIALHDILPRSDIVEIEVDQFWNEIKDQYQSEEIIGSDNSGRKIGWGIIHT